MPSIGTPAQPLRVAVIGAGPAAFYAADHLLKYPGLNVEVDMFDGLLVEYCRDRDLDSWGFYLEGLLGQLRLCQGRLADAQRIADRVLRRQHTPAINRIDARLSKSLTFKDRWKVTGIVEAFNLFNHSNFGSYSLSITTASFGAPASNANLAYAPRMIQVAGRFDF